MSKNLLTLQLDTLVSRINAIARRLFDEDAILLVALVNYGFVRLSGHIEQVHKALYHDYAARHGSPSLVKFIDKSISSTTNVNSEKCMSLLSRFDTRLGIELKDRIEMAENGKWKVALDGTYGIRNSQAHGGTQSADLAKLNQFVRDVKEYLDYLESLLA